MTLLNTKIFNSESVTSAKRQVKYTGQNVRQVATAAGRHKRVPVRSIFLIFVDVLQDLKL